MIRSFVFAEPVRFLVVHPQLGEKIVFAYCVVDAKLQASIEWEVPFEDVVKNCKIGVDKAALKTMEAQFAKEET